MCVQTFRSEFAIERLDEFRRRLVRAIEIGVIKPGHHNNRIPWFIALRQEDWRELWTQ